MIKLPQQLTPFGQKNTHLKTPLKVAEIEPTFNNLNCKYLFVEH